MSIKCQREFFEGGNTLSYQSRKQALQKLKECIKKNEKEIAAALKEDLGKSSTEAFMSEIALFYDDIDFNLKNLKKNMRPKRSISPISIFPAKSRIYQSPYGVVLIIAPWNYPFLLTVEPMAEAIAAGNCCVVKPSEHAPATSKVLTHIIEENFPKELICFVNGGVEESKTLLEEDFDYIFYTGNTSVGKYVMEKASKHLTPVTLELGGKSPVIVTASSNLKFAARRVAFGKFMNAGQTCVAPDYVLVEKSVHDDFIKLLKDEIVKMYGEKPLTNDNFGKIINKRHFDRLMGLLDKNKVVFGGESSEEILKISPTILDGVTGDDPVMQEEIFGPLLPVISVNSLDEAYNFIKKNPHPLALYLFTKDSRVEKKFMHELQFGGGCVNDVMVHLSNHNLPFGGIGDSGIGIYHGKYSFETFSHPKSIVKGSSLIDIPVRYQPLTAWKDKFLRIFM